MGRACFSLPSERSSDGTGSKTNPGSRSRKPGTDGTASEFPAKGAGNPWQSRQSPEGTRTDENRARDWRSISRRQTGYSQPIPKAGIGGSPRFTAHARIWHFRERFLQDFDQHRRFDVFAEGLLQLEFLRPFDVVAHVGHIDTGTRDLQLVQNLHCLKLDDARAAQPGQRDVLRQLTVRPCRRTEGRGRAMAMEFHRQVQPGDAAEELVVRRSEALY